MKRSTIGVIIGAAVAMVLAAVALPFLGLAIFFRQEIKDWVGLVDRTKGARLVYEMQPAAPDEALPGAEQVCKSILRRTDPDGRWGVEVALRGERQVEVAVFGPPERVERVKRLLSQVGRLEFRILADKIKDRDKANVDRLVRLKEEGQPPDSARWRWCVLKKGREWQEANLLDAMGLVYVADEQGRKVEVLVDMGDGQNVTGQDLASAKVTLSDGEPAIAFNLKPEASTRFSRLTSPENRERHLGIILDGVIQAAPMLMATLSTGGIIDGYKTRQELQDVVSILNSGELGCRLGDPVHEEWFGPGRPQGSDGPDGGIVPSPARGR